MNLHKLQELSYDYDSEPKISENNGSSSKSFRQQFEERFCFYFKVNLNQPFSTKKNKTSRTCTLRKIWHTTLIQSQKSR